MKINIILMIKNKFNQINNPKAIIKRNKNLPKRKIINIAHKKNAIYKIYKKNIIIKFN